MAKLWRRAWGWVGTGDRRSSSRRTSLGPSRFPGGCRRALPGGLPSRVRADLGAPSQARMRLGAPVVDEHLALFGALAGHRDHPPGEVHVVDVEAAQLGHPQPGCRRAARARRRPDDRRPAWPRPRRGPSAPATRPARRGRGPGGGGSRGPEPTGGSTGRRRPGPASRTTGSSDLREAAVRAMVDFEYRRVARKARYRRRRIRSTSAGALGPAPARPLGEPLGVRRVRPHRGRRQTAHRSTERFDLPGHSKTVPVQARRYRAPPAPAVAGPVTSPQMRSHHSGRSKVGRANVWLSRHRSSSTRRVTTDKQCHCVRPANPFRSGPCPKGEHV